MHAGFGFPRHEASDVTLSFALPGKQSSQCRVFDPRADAGTNRRSVPDTSNRERRTNGGTPHPFARGLLVDRRLLRFAQPQATLRSLLHSAIRDEARRGQAAWTASAGSKFFCCLSMVQETARRRSATVRRARP